MIAVISNQIKKGIGKERKKSQIELIYLETRSNTSVIKKYKLKSTIPRATGDMKSTPREIRLRIHAGCRLDTAKRGLPRSPPRDRTNRLTIS